MNPFSFTAATGSVSRIVVSVVLLTGVFQIARAGPGEDGQPNIIVILVDDLGYGDPQCFNPESRIPTPNIDALARDGMKFTDAHASGPLCHMSRYGLMTGRYPFRTDVSKWPTEPLIDAEQATIASLCKSSGYHTAMVGKWHLGFREQGYDRPLPGGPIDVGFESFFGIRASTDIPPYFYIRGDRAVTPPTETIRANATEGWSPIQGEFWRAGGIAPGLELKDVLPRFTDEAIGVIESHADAKDAKPLMLYLAYPARHTPWLPSAEFSGKSPAGMYGDFVMMVDAMIGRVLAAVDNDKMSDNTLVIFSSDNGPVWYERDVERFGHDASGGLRGMKGDAWECGHRMPLVARWPGRIEPNSVSHQMISFVDFLATFADLLGVQLQHDAGPDSFSFLPVLLGQQNQDDPVRDALLVRSASGAMTIRVGQFKLITSLGSGGFSLPKRVQPVDGGPTGQLYDLAADLGETNNLFTTRPEIVERLMNKLQSVRDAGHHR